MTAPNQTQTQDSTDRVCTKCKERKPIDQFAVVSNHVSSAYILTRCRLCTAVYAAKYGKDRGPEYAVWSGMRQRCRNKNNPHYKDYGGRGITLCDAWSTYDAFISDMGKRPTALHQIDRIDNDNGYCKSNCKWATRTENMRHTRRTVLTMQKARQIRKEFSEGGKTKAQIAREYCVGDTAIQKVIKFDTWREESV